ncbi:unnamed protein product [Adineta steineri]|uniref:Uncharacterized protein n=1 Tax=Adineta steineri TaxID=433720 RepID=A0A816AHC3_9BILA|nr:unnamed protein product [Adineta steineri]CAF1349715.1 unnamed protein product [Adineta steineri]CAF1596176.1 unnamed protein product [Adineta steineri]CAF1596208.1 unnamed protein product [Adineta steineri]
MFLSNSTLYKVSVLHANKIIPVCIDLYDWKATKEAVRPHLTTQLLLNNSVVAILHSLLEVNSNGSDAYEIARDLVEREMSSLAVNVSGQAAAAVDGLTRVMTMKLGPH